MRGYFVTFKYNSFILAQTREEAKEALYIILRSLDRAKIKESISIEEKD